MNRLAQVCFNITKFDIFILVQIGSKSIKFLSLLRDRDLDLDLQQGQSRHGDNVPVNDVDCVLISSQNNDQNQFCSVLDCCESLGNKVLVAFGNLCSSQVRSRSPFQYQKTSTSVVFFFWLFLKSLPLIQVTGKLFGWINSFSGFSLWFEPPGRRLGK